MRVDTKQHFLLPVTSGTDALCCPRHCELVRLVPLGNEKSNGGTANLVCGFAGTRSNEEIAPIRAIRPVGRGALLDRRRMGAAVV
jgi:hypothetical protein